MTSMVTRSNVRLDADRKMLAAEGAPPKLDLIIKDMQKKCRQVHVAFIFDKTYGLCETWRILMLMLNGTAKNGLNRNGDWQAFSNELGLERHQILSIENVQPGFEDPVTNTLLAFAQRPDATLDRIVDALNEMERHDILLKISEPISELCDKVVRANSETCNVTSDSGFSESAVSAESTTVIKPNYIPDVPCLLRNKEDLHFNIIYSGFKSANASATLCKSSMMEETIEHNMLIQSPDEGYENDASPKKANPDAEASFLMSSNFDTTVLLTFAEDGLDTAMKVARVLRATQNSRGEHVGVVILEEQQQFLNSDPQAFVRGVFEQVDYVIPIITPEYIQAIKPNCEVNSTDCLDAEYTRFIYKLIENYYTSNCCMNKKIRTILPSGTENIIVNKIKQNPVFRPYNWYENMVNTAKKICLRKF